MANVLLGVFMVSTLGILVVGIVGMAAGGDFNEKYGNKLMMARVTSQFLAIATLLLFFAAK